jgi:hypothetical protein
MRQTAHRREQMIHFPRATRWSTVGDLSRRSSLVANFRAIGNRGKGLVVALADALRRHDLPGENKGSNWLPAPTTVQPGDALAMPKRIEDGT